MVLTSDKSGTKPNVKTENGEFYEIFRFLLVTRDRSEAVARAQPQNKSSSVSLSGGGKNTGRREER